MATGISSLFTGELCIVCNESTCGKLGDDGQHCAPAPAPAVASLAGEPAKLSGYVAVKASPPSAANLLPLELEARHGVSITPCSGMWVW